MKRALVFALSLFATPLVGEEDPGRRQRDSGLWKKLVLRHQRELSARKVDVCFIGDSLTEFWTTTGRPVWDLDFHQWSCVNLGIAADRAGDILVRIKRMDFSRAKPRVFVLMAGTNDLSKQQPDTPVAVARTVTRVAPPPRRFQRSRP